MSQAFVLKIKKIVLQNLGDENFGVSELATKMGLSRSQLLRKVKTSVNKSANQLIREIRLEQAVQLLNDDDFTISEIAYKVGFGSPSYFNKCFHNQFGCTPGDYQKQKEKPLYSYTETKHKTIPKFIIVAIGLLLIGTTTIFFWKNNGNKSSVKEQPSIAVLPLLDLTNKDNNIKHLAIGLTDAIITELSKIPGLRVISRGSSMMFQDSVKLYADIANKLNVNLLLEGSIFYDGDDFRITLQLIDPYPIEKHLWANNYKQSRSNIINLAGNVSTEIANTIRLKPINSLERKQPNNEDIDPEVQELFLRGNYLLLQQNPQSVKTALTYFQKVISIDSLFAQAYCSIAEAYILLNKFIRNNEEKLLNRIKSRQAIDNALNKAIEIDGSLAEAFITKGYLHGKFDWDWENMKSMADKGLQINPNNTKGYRLLSDYYLIRGNYAKAIEEALKAEKLDPLNPTIGCLVAEKYMYAGEYEKAVDQFQKILELYPRYGFAWDGLGYTQFVMGEKEKAKESFKKLQEIMGNQEMADFFKNENFDTSINFWLSKATTGSKLYCSNPPIIAMAHLFVDKQPGAMEYLELAYKYKNEDLPIIILRPNFSQLYDNPHFTEIVRAVDVTIPNL